MSRTIYLVWIDFGREHTLSTYSSRIGKTSSKILHYVLLEIQRIEKKRMNQISFIDSIVLDVVRKKDRSSQIDCIIKYVHDSIKHDRFSRRLIPDEAGKSAVATPFHPVDICISEHRLEPVLSFDLFCPKEENAFSGEEATEKQSNELRGLSFSPAGKRWRDRRHRRRRTCVYWSAPWKLNSDRRLTNASERSVLRCA